MRRLFYFNSSSGKVSTKPSLIGLEGSIFGLVLRKMLDSGKGKNTGTRRLSAEFLQQEVCLYHVASNHW